MKIEVFGEGVTSKKEVNGPHRIGCRGIIHKDGSYLMTHLSLWDIYTFPGGGLETGETLEECVVREVLEETGIKCEVVSKTCSVTEYFPDSAWTNHYFICEFVEDTGKQALVQEEIELGLQAKWMTLEEILDQFENNMTNHKHGPQVHNREFLGLINSI